MISIYFLTDFVKMDGSFYDTKTKGAVKKVE